jgi:hypothetical protein
VQGEMKGMKDFEVRSKAAAAAMPPVAEESAI